MEGYEKKGYLSSDFKLFHLSDDRIQDFEFHYHDFDKIIIFIKGHVTYRIEGCAYELKPYDMVLVSHNDIHKPDIDPDSTYERMIVYLSPDFLRSYHTEEYDLSDCFQKSRELKSHVLRIHSMEKSSLFSTLTKLEYACTHEDYAKDLYCQVVFLEFIIQLNRACLKNRVTYLSPATSDRRIQTVMDYVNSHLTDSLTIASISASCYISRYHLMHLFKKETGCTIGSYITEKRLLMARDLLRNGMAVADTCFFCGFQNYSTFSRAYKKYFHTPPSAASKETFH